MKRNKTMNETTSPAVTPEPTLSPPPLKPASLLDLELLYDILHVESESRDTHDMEWHLIGVADAHEDWEWEQDKAGNLYLTKGEGPYPCVVSHMDTVHAITGNGIAVVRLGDRLTGLDPVTMVQTGIGGDDKCGIYAALHLMKTLPSCKAVFFVDEEIGCVGSWNCDLSFFKDCKYVLQADRRGNSDFVDDISGPLTSHRFDQDVAPILKRFGYKPCCGMMTDVEALRDQQVGVSVCNMSAGYYNPHQDCEYIDLVDLENVVRLMLAICQEMTEVYPFTWKPKKKWGKGGGWIGFASGGSGKIVVFDGEGKEIVMKEDTSYLDARKKTNPHLSTPTADKFPDYDPKGPAYYSKAFGWDDEEEEETPGYLGLTKNEVEALNSMYDEDHDAEQWEKEILHEQEQIEMARAEFEEKEAMRIVGGGS